MGVHPKVVQERLGHASIQTTMDIYSHVAPNLKKKQFKTFLCLFLHRKLMSRYGFFPFLP